MGCEVTVAQGSLTDGDERVLVNASNTEVALGSGVSAAIRVACGPGYQEHIRDELKRARGGSLEPGDVFVTDAGSHPRAAYVAHCAVMDYRAGSTGPSGPDEARIEQICRALWPAVDALGDGRTVAMVALGAGVGNLGVRRPTEIACATLQAHLDAHPGSRLERVCFYGYQLHEFAVIAEVVSSFFEVPAGAIPAEVKALFEG